MVACNGGKAQSRPATEGDDAGHAPSLNGGNERNETQPRHEDDCRVFQSYANACQQARPRKSVPLFWETVRGGQSEKSQQSPAYEDRIGEVISRHTDQGNESSAGGTNQEGDSPERQALAYG